ncbi:50S ribosomal protein L21, partial [Candidatus Microgenomates bacterium]|nr:50S ribosomal protein L21 [Candidatus Microgenomates bacterium]
MKQAVIQAGGKQYLVRQDQELEIDLIDGAAGKKLGFEPLLIFDEKSTQVGQPTVKGGKVTAEVVKSEVKGAKVKIMKFKAKKRVKKMTGHRQK